MLEFRLQDAEVVEGFISHSGFETGQNMVAHSQRQEILSEVRFEPLQKPHAMLAQGGEGRIGFARQHRSIQRAVRQKYALSWLWLQGVSMAIILTMNVKVLAMDF